MEAKVSVRAADLMAYRVPIVEQELSAKDCMLYALGLGIGADPTDEAQLHYVHEKDLRVLPTMASILAHPGFWMRNQDAGIDWRRVVHVQQSIAIHDRLPVSGRLMGQSRVIGVEDRGPEKGAIVRTRREISLAETGTLVATATQTVLCRGDGGIGSVGETVPRIPPPPETPPHVTRATQTLPQQALIYRLSGDSTRFTPIPWRQGRPDFRAQSSTASLRSESRAMLFLKQSRTIM